MLKDKPISGWGKIDIRKYRNALKDLMPKLISSALDAIKVEFVMESAMIYNRVMQLVWGQDMTRPQVLASLLLYEGAIQNRIDLLSSANANSKDDLQVTQMAL